MWPAPPLPAPAAPPPKKEAEAKKELTPEEIYADTLKSALTTSECDWERWCRRGLQQGGVHGRLTAGLAGMVACLPWPALLLALCHVQLTVLLNAVPRPPPTAPPAAVGLSCIVGLGAVSPGPAFSSMMTKFGLASICGYQTVW